MVKVVRIVGSIIVERANPVNFVFEAPAVLEGESAGSQKQNCKKAAQLT